MLANTNMPITEISQSVGFNSFSYFGRAFKKLVGTTPRTYRNKQ
ncbi:helix-turn-helix domain-containing protein [Paenibacillus marchantiophytorum]|nr:helix-turn-helix domain-containing protein [Paenibacillus marchantiophytorum]